MRTAIWAIPTTIPACIPPPDRRRCRLSGAPLHPTPLGSDPLLGLVVDRVIAASCDRKDLEHRSPAYVELAVDDTVLRALHANRPAALENAAERLAGLRIGLQPAQRGFDLRARLPPRSFSHTSWRS